jgi:hypothetical protein
MEERNGPILDTLDGSFGDGFVIDTLPAMAGAVYFISIVRENFWLKVFSA